MPPRKAKRNDGRFAFTIRYVDPVTGEKRAYFYGKTQGQASKAEQARQRLTQGAPVRDASRTLADWLAEWLVTFLEAGNRARSTKTMHEGYCTRIIPTLGHIRLDRLTVADVNRLMLAMKDAGKADATRRNAYTTLRKSLDDAVLSGLLATNPAHKVSQPRAKRKQARYLTIEEVTRLLTGADDLRYATLRTFSGRFRMAAKRAGLSGVNVHTLRHTYATTALLHGVPLKVVSVNLGHASIQITADIYGHVSDDAARAGAEGCLSRPRPGSCEAARLGLPCRRTLPTVLDGTTPGPAGNLTLIGVTTRMAA
jgi:site-specific recombinase XerD